MITEDTISKIDFTTEYTVWIQTVPLRKIHIPVLVDILLLQTDIFYLAPLDGTILSRKQP